MTSFTSVNLDGVATYSIATFENTAKFDFSTLTNATDFNRADFADVSFLATQFEGGVEFRGTRFNGKADFSGAFFDKRTYFNGANNVINVDEYNPPEYIFSRLVLSKDAQVFFEKMDFFKASFQDTNLEELTFRDVGWSRPTTRIQRWVRQEGLWDEFAPISQYADRDYEKIAENYRQLVLNYEKKRDYDVAESFHIGEMEMRRKKKGDDYVFWRWRNFRWVGEWLNSYNVYRLASNYGTSYWQALLILFMLILTLSLAFLSAGFQPSKESAGLETHGLTKLRVNNDAAYLITAT
ncbi:MAG: pentapeptide repeat-containing protein [Pyrinomonadaceae bacterium]